MRTQNLMLKHMLASIGVTVPLQIPDVPDIPSLTKFSTNSESNETHPPTYDHPHRTLLIQNKSKKHMFHTRDI